MTDLLTRPADNPGADGPPKRRRTYLYVLVAVAVLATTAFGAYWVLFRDDSAKSVTTGAAADARNAAIAEAAPAAEPAASTGDLGGTWNVDTTIGTFSDACLTSVCDSAFVGFRIDEELASIGAKTVVGRTPGVSGTVVIDGTTLVDTDLTVDMSGLVTDSSARTNALRRQSIETEAFPEASFSLTSAIDFGTVPAPGEQVDVPATGDLTIHGVTRSVTIPLTAELQGDVIVVFGQLGIQLADFDIAAPQAAVVLSVEDSAILELQLFLTR